MRCAVSILCLCSFCWGFFRCFCYKLQHFARFTIWKRSGRVEQGFNFQWVEFQTTFVGRTSHGEDCLFNRQRSFHRIRGDSRFVRCRRELLLQKDSNRGSPQELYSIDLIVQRSSGSDQNPFDMLRRSIPQNVGTYKSATASSPKAVLYANGTSPYSATTPQQSIKAVLTS